MSKHQSRSDPLQLLRNTYANKKYKIKLKGKDLVFEKEAKLNLKTQTPWMSPHTQKRYNLGSIWLFLQHHFQNIPTSTQYLQKVSQYDLEAVNIADKDETIKYFTGKITQTAYINQQLKLSLSQNKKRDHPSGGFQGMEDGLTKKIKGESSANFDLQVIDYLVTFERPTNSKSRCMHFHSKSFESILTKIYEQQKITQVSQSNKQTGSSRYRIMNIIQKKKLPIIIIPERKQLGNVTLGNIQKFLTGYQYFQNLQLENSWASKTQFNKQLRGKTITFQVTNRPNLLLQKDWDNVVGIFVQGKQNQFEGWPRTIPGKVFEKIPGFFLRYSKTSVQFSQQWKVMNLIIQKNTRYGDKQIVDIIWKNIENYIFQKV